MNKEQEKQVLTEQEIQLLGLLGLYFDTINDMVNEMLNTLDEWLNEINKENENEIN